MEHTNVLQDWSLMVEFLVNPQFKDISLETKVTLSELFLESVHHVLTGLTSKVRPSSRRVNEVDLMHHQLIADEIYPSLAVLLVTFRKQPVIATNILKIAVKIKPEYLSDDHIKAVEELLQTTCLKFFMYWIDTDVLTAFLDFLVLVYEHVPRLSAASRNVVEDLKKYVSEQLYKSFISKDRHTLVMARKTAITFSKFDLNNNIEWGKLLVSWDILESNVEYLEDAMKSCHWSLIWKIRRLSSTHISNNERITEVSSLTRMVKTFFSICSELMDNEDRNIKFKVFERVCETKLAFCQELENISKQIRALGDLKEVKDEALQNQIMNIFELSVGTCEATVARKYAMYIVNMAFFDIIPMECISIIFKYYNVHYDTYGKLIETVLSVMLEKGDNWVPIIVVNTLCSCFEKLVPEHGVLDIRSQEAKDVLNLSRKFAEYKKIKNPKIASKVLVYAINYVYDTTSYTFLIFVRVFINELVGNPVLRAEILDHLKRKVPKCHVNNQYVLYFGGHLTGAEPKKTNVPNKPIKRGRRRINAPKLNIQARKVKREPKDKENVAPIIQSQTTDTDESDDMTIHDTSSDDLDLDISNLNVSSQS